MRGRPRRSHHRLAIATSLGLSLAGWTGIARSQAVTKEKPGVTAGKQPVTTGKQPVTTGKQPVTTGKQEPNEFHLTATVGERTNSNVFFEAGEPQGDYISTLVLALNVRRTSPRTEWSLNYRPILSHYLDFSELDSFSQAFDGGASYRLGERTRLLIRETFTLSRDPVIVALPQSGESPILTNTQKRWRNLSGFDFTQDLSRSLSWAGGVQYYANRFDDPGSTDNNGLIGDLSLTAVLGKEDTLTGSYTPGFVSFYSSEPTFAADPCATAIPDQLVVQTISQTQGSTAHQFGVGWTHSDARAWETEISLGSSLVDQQVRDYTRTIICQPGLIESESEETDDRGKNQRLFVGRAGLKKSFLRFDVDGGYQRRLTADTGADTVTVGDSLFANLNGRIGRQFTYGIGLDYSTRKSLGGAITAVDIVSEGVILRGDYAINEWCSLTAIANFREQINSGVAADTQSVDNYFIGVAFRIF
jgi:hypothetical protein